MASSRDVTASERVGRKARLAQLVGLHGWVEDGRTEVPLGLAALNFFVQRVFRVNAGTRFPVHFTSVVVAGERLNVGRGVARYLAMSPGLYIQALNGIQIGDDVMIGPHVRLVSANHAHGSSDDWEAAAPIIVGDRVWIAAGATVLPGVRVGDDAIIGAGAVVTRDVPVGVTVVGVPARASTRAGQARLDDTAVPETSPKGDTLCDDPR